VLVPVIEWSSEETAISGGCWCTVLVRSLDGGSGRLGLVTSAARACRHGRMVYLWRAVDAEGEVLHVLVQTRRNKRAALKLMRKLLKKYGFAPDKLVTDDLRSYAAATFLLPKRSISKSDIDERGVVLIPIIDWSIQEGGTIQCHFTYIF
jgi:hypothetical protein